MSKSGRVATLYTDVLNIAVQKQVEFSCAIESVTDQNRYKNRSGSGAPVHRWSHQVEYLFLSSES